MSTYVSGAIVIAAAVVKCCPLSCFEVVYDGARAVNTILFLLVRKIDLTAIIPGKDMATSSGFSCNNSGFIFACHKCCDTA